MKTDRELLELAAKAAENGAHWDIEYQCMVIKVDCKAGYNYERWNPLEDDGDALRLAVKLGISITQPGNSGNSVWDIWDKHHQRPDPCAETRRAIVLAAAEVGKGMLTHDEFVQMFPGRFQEDIERAAAESNQIAASPEDHE